jgi:hypothetical protein
MKSLHRLSPPLRAMLALWLLLGLLVAPVQAARHAGAMASGQLVCSAAGAYFVGADGELLPADGLGGHDCCQAAATALPPTVAGAVPAAFTAVDPPPAAIESTASAPAVLPPARGPPAFRDVPTVLR